MDYKNFFIRFLLSLFLIFIYFLISYINFDYIFYLILFVYILIFLEIFLYFKVYKFIPIIYLLISFIFFLLIDFNNQTFLNFSYYVFIVITFDTFSYITGKFFGRNKLIKISPNKTIEGFFGGISISFFLSILMANIFNYSIEAKLTTFIFFIILFSFIGDIIESYFKRLNKLKNSSELIPGHGGVFDRFDSFLFSIIFYSIFTNI